MKVVIVEDDFIVADHLKSILNKHKVDVMAMADNRAAALAVAKQDPDLYLVDIRLANNDSGIDLGRDLKDLDIPFIYVTANNEMQTLKEAIETSPQAYITKPYKESDILAFLEIFKQHKEPTISVKTKFGKKFIKLSTVVFFRSDGPYIDIITDEDTYTERNSLSVLEKMYSNHFIRIHRSYLVNKNRIESHTSKDVQIADQSLPISRSYKRNLKLINQ